MIIKPKMEKMKKVTFILILLMGLNISNAQSDTIAISLDEMKIEILKTNNWYMANQLNLAGYDFGNDPLNQELYAAAMSKKKSQKKTGTGSVIIGLGILTMVYSLVAINSIENGTGISYDNGVSVASSALLGAGVAAISIPFFVSSGKHKKESIRHIAIAKEMYGNN